jgi:hypothetical protein
MGEGVAFLTQAHQLVWSKIPNFPAKHLNQMVNTKPFSALAALAFPSAILDEISL